MHDFIQFVINHWALWSALVIILLLIFVNESQEAGLSEQIPPQEAINKINHDDAIVFDLRKKETYREGHIVDAINITNDAFTNKNMDKYKTKPIILVCANGSQSSLLIKQVKSSGFEQAYMLKGGMSAWLNASFPVVKHKSAMKKQLKAAKAAND